MKPPRPALLPLGALAAGFAFAQNPPPEPAASAAGATAVSTEPATLPNDAEVLPAVRVRAQSTRDGKAAYQAERSSVGRGRQELRDIPQSVTVVTEKLMDDKGQDTLKSALHGVAGIAFEAGEGGGIGDLIRLRGFSARGDLYIDGLRDIAQYNRDNFALDRVEVLRGAASMLYGRGSTGGVVNQASKRPQPLDRAEVSTTVGDDHLRSTADLNRVVGTDAALRLNAMLTEAGSTRGGPRTSRQGIAPSLNWGIGTRDEFLVSFYHLQYDDVPDYGFRWFANRPVDAAAERWYGTASDYQRDATTHGTLEHIHRFGGGHELRTLLRQGRTTRDLWATTAGFANTLSTLGDLTDATAITRGNQTRGATDGQRFLLSEYTGKAQALGMAHQWIAGVDLSDERSTSFGYAGTPAKPATTWGASGGSEALADTRVRATTGRFRARTVGVYAQDTLALAPTWKLVAGVRHDRSNGEFNNLSETIPTQWTRDDALWSGRIGAIWQPHVEASYYASASNAFNTTGDLYQFGASTNPPAAFVAASCAGTLNDACRIAYGAFTGGLSARTPPEESRNLEVGAKWEAEDGRLSLRTAVFRTEKTNERNTDVDSATQSFLLNAARHTDGVEFEAAGRAGAAVELFGSLAWMRGRVDAAAPSVRGTAADITGEDPGLTPRWSGGFWAIWRFAPRWRAGFGFDGRSTSKPAGAELSTNRAPGYIKADAMLEVELAPMSLQLNLNNVFDKVYADGIYRGHVVPGPTRQVLLTLTTRL